MKRKFVASQLGEKRARMAGWRRTGTGSTFARAILVAFVGAAATAVAATEASRPGHLRLVDRLDRPGDGYCLDILGVGQNMRLEVPIFAHNCKPALTPDSAVTLMQNGAIQFVAVGLCATAAGVNGRALPGSAIILRPCGDRARFFESGPLQAFDFRADGRLALKGSDLCLAVGEVSATTYSNQDRWRVLSMQDCATTPSSLSRWEFNPEPISEP